MTNDATNCRECGQDESEAIYNPECSECESRKVEDIAARDYAEWRIDR